jgi:nickel transport protein
MKVKRVLLSLVMLGSLGLSHQALAHKLNLFAFAEGDAVSVEGYFADGKKAQNSAVKVLDSSGKVLVEGVTDDQGKYSFKIPQKTDLKIVLNAGMGHQGEFAMSAAELGDRSAAASESAVVETTATAPVASSELEATVHRAVSEAIKPLVRELTESQQKASISEMVGAIGYIFGLLGLFAFYKARQASGKKSPE